MALTIGRELKRSREAKGLTLDKLSELTGDHHPAKRRMTSGQISRIENAMVAPDLPELQLLCLSLECDLRELLKPAPEPWFVVRQAKWEEWLQEITATPPKRVIKRETQRHDNLIINGTYRYVPLEDDPAEVEGAAASSEDPIRVEGLVLQNEHGAAMNPRMRKNILIVGKLNRNKIPAALYSHAGEEIIFVLDGELEFWHSDRKVKDLRELAAPLVLGPGDCLHFSSKLWHAFRAPGEQSVRAFQVFCEADATRRDFYVAKGEEKSRPEF